VTAADWYPEVVEVLVVEVLVVEVVFSRTTPGLPDP